MNLRNAYRTILAGLLTLAIITAINTNNTFATASTLTLSISNSTVSMNMAPTNTNGSFSKSSATTISASTTNATGYTLSISAPTGAGSDYDKLINSTDNTAKLNSITASTTEEQFKALSGTAYNNMWGYLPSKYCSDGTTSTCASNTLFLPAPTTAGDVLDQTSTANTTANTYALGMGARIDSTTKTGSYSNSYVVKLVANAIPYTITYDDSIVSNMPTDVDSTSTSTTVQISSSVPTRSGYKFLGWCSGTVTTTSDTDSCSGTTYAPGSNYTLDQTGGANNLSLVAMWGEVSYMQSFTTAKCSAMSTGDTLKLTDSRDDQEYTIGKLADGKCWMLDNLALDLTNDTILNALTADNTNIDTSTDPGALAALKGTTPGTTSDKYATAKVANWTSSNSYSAPLVNLTNKDVIPQGSDPMASTVLAGGWKVGGYYNYCAASAGSYCYGDGTSAGTSSGNATSSICPKGWRMPAGNTTGEYSALANAIYGSTGSTSDATAVANYRSALHLPLSGYFYDGSADYQGSDGYWWSSTRGNHYGMYDLNAVTSGIYPADRSYRDNGYSVRCVLGS